MNQVKCCWGLNTLLQSTTYLGVSLFLSKCKTQDFKFVKERLGSKLSGQKSKNLSWFGRATLIRLVAQAIPAYSMLAILFPKGLCDQLDALVRRFWWSPKSKASSYWTSMSWSSLYWPQKESALGFRKFWDFNQALLSKLGRWILSGKDCRCIKVLREKYKIWDNWLSHHSSSNAFTFWKSMMGIKHLIAKATWRLVGNGDSIRTWLDPWILDLPSFRFGNPKFMSASRYIYGELLPMFCLLKR